MNQYLDEKLLYAADEMDTSKVYELIHRGANVNGQSKKTGMTPFQIAAALNDWSTLRVLLKSGNCNLLIKDKQNLTILDYLNNSDFDSKIKRLVSNLQKKQTKRKFVSSAQKG